uniref:Uncharacterized protein n=1 Tax=Parascaris equorum TaxID=6256 RepID=A0A914RLR7_PAREQ
MDRTGDGSKCNKAEGEKDLEEFFPPSLHSGLHTLKSLSFCKTHLDRPSSETLKFQNQKRNKSANFLWYSRNS